jgi:hypothetical protein
LASLALSIAEQARSGFQDVSSLSAGYQKKIAGEPREVIAIM